jgi:hypothetical protein
MAMAEETLVVAHHGWPAGREKRRPRHFRRCDGSRKVRSRISGIGVD